MPSSDFMALQLRRKCLLFPFLHEKPNQNKPGVSTYSTRRLTRSQETLVTDGAAVFAASLNTFNSSLVIPAAIAASQVDHIGRIQHVNNVSQRYFFLLFSVDIGQRPTALPAFVCWSTVELSHKAKYISKLLQLAVSSIYITASDVAAAVAVETAVLFRTTFSILPSRASLSHYAMYQHN